MTGRIDNFGPVPGDTSDRVHARESLSTGAQRLAGPSNHTTLGDDDHPVVWIEHRACGGHIEVLDDGSFMCPNCGPLSEHDR